MRIAPCVEMLEVAGGNSMLRPALLWDDQNVVLVDACYPLQFGALKLAVENAGFQVSDITALILTHQDIDHIGCVKELLEVAPNMEIMAHVEEAPYIDGRKTPIKLAALEENFDNLPENMKAVYANLKTGFDNRRFAIQRLLTDGEVLPFCGGVDVIHTPGHTPGHICLFVREGGVLITGDALNMQRDMLCGPNPQYTQDMDRAHHSLECMKNYAIQTVLCYHGGVFTGNFEAALDKILQ